MVVIITLDRMNPKAYHGSVFPVGGAASLRSVSRSMQQSLKNEEIQGPVVVLSLPTTI
jgi:hypothetical protein